MNSSSIKLALMKYFRFQRGMIVGAEVNYSDILAITQDKSISYEVEIKISLSDLKKEFKDKIKKHENLNLVKKLNPNYFYFCVPYYLYDKAKEIIHGYSKNYGIFVYIENSDKNENFYDSYVVLKDRAKKLNASDNENLFIDLIKRISSDIINCYIRLYK